MNKEEEIKRLLSDTLKVRVSDIGNAFPLRTGKLKTSAGSVIISNIVRKVCGVKVDCRKVSTFGELMSLIHGEPEEPEKESSVVAEEERARDKSIIPPAVVPAGRIVCGIDIQEIDIFPEADDYWTESFYTENFTKDEIAYCVTAASPRHSFAARWCVKEALHKCGPEYYGLPFSDIQVVKQRSGAVSLEVLENGSWMALPLSCSLSHADCYAAGMVTGFSSAGRVDDDGV